MNYNAWSELIRKYYFRGNNTSRVMFHITMQDLVDFAKEQNVMIAKDKYASEFDDAFIESDFVHKFWRDQNGNPAITDLQMRISQLRDQCFKEDNLQALLPIVALLIMPICENDDLELHGNDYYGHLLTFLHTHHFVNKEVHATRLLSEIKLDKIWDAIDHWAEKNELPFKSTSVLTSNGTMQYVRSLMKESLLSPSKLQKFGILFDHAGLVPKVNIEDERLLSAFTNYHPYIGIPQSRFKQLISKDFREYLLNVLRSEYDDWDGTTRIKERDRHTGKIRVEAGNTCFPLLLNMDYDLHNNKCTFSFLLSCPDSDDISDYMYFVADSNKAELPKIYIKKDGYANQPFRLTDAEMNEIFSSRQGGYSIHAEDDKSQKGRHVVTDYYLLRQYKNKYIATSEFIKGEFYFAVIRHEAAADFTDWLHDNAAVLVADDVLAGVYSVYRIEHAAVELPLKNNLRFKNEIRCKSVNNLEVKIAEDTDVVYLTKLLPAQFEITGVDVSKDRVYAVSVGDSHRNVSELKYNHDSKLWILKVFTDFFQIQKEFQLYCNEAPIPYGKTYKFMDFVLPSEFKELALNQWGGIEKPTLSTGLELPSNVINKNLINWYMLTLQMGNAPAKPITIGKYQERDYLLYTITSASYQTSRWIISMPWLKDIKDRLDSEFSDDESQPRSDKYALHNVLADYFRMGYINYAYTDNGFYLTANRPTLILLTPEYERSITPGLIGKNIVKVSCAENHYKCLLTGGRTIALIQDIVKYQQTLGYQVEFAEESDYLQPQTIYIHADKRSVFAALAQKCNLLYQDNIYANTLLEVLPSVEDYLTELRRIGTERELFDVPNFRAIDYQKMAALYPERLAAGRAIANNEIDKEEFDKQNDVVTFFPGSRDETSILIEDGRMMEMDKYWGHFVAMFKSHAQILQFDRDRAQISLPQQFRLPLLYARALTLLTGKTPDSVFGSRTYSLGVNPCTFSSNPELILQKLGQ